MKYMVINDLTGNTDSIPVADFDSLIEWFNQHFHEWTLFKLPDETFGLSTLRFGEYENYTIYRRET